MPRSITSNVVCEGVDRRKAGFVMGEGLGSKVYSFWTVMGEHGALFIEEKMSLMDGAF